MNENKENNIDNEKMISANEINKYVYCNYQWYYERYYGKKEIREKYVLRNEKLGLYDKTTSNFNKGNDFHNSYLPKNIFKTILKIVVFLIIVFVALAFCYFLFV